MSKQTLNNMPRMMEQERAKFALKRITELSSSNHVSALPALIHMNGLGQALAFYRMKGKQTEQGQEQKNNHKALYDLISDWLCGERDAETAGQIFKNHDDVLKAIANGDMFQYMAAQNEALALLEWVKKFANAYLEKGE